MNNLKRQETEKYKETELDPDTSGIPVIIEFRQDILGQKLVSINSENIPKKIYEFTDSKINVWGKEEETKEDDDEIVFNDINKSVRNRDMNDMMENRMNGTKEPKKSDTSGVSPGSESESGKDHDEIIIISNKEIYRAHNMKNKNQPLL